jgi:hypothetical protein
LGFLRDLLDDAIIVDTFPNTVIGWVNFALALLSIAAFVAFIFAGGLYITAYIGGEKNVERAKKILTWTTIGIILVLTSYTITSSIFRGTV